MQPFGIIIKAAIKGAAFVNAIDVRLLLIRFLPDDSHPVHQSKTSYVGKHLYCVLICVRYTDICPQWLIVCWQVCCCCPLALCPIAHKQGFEK